MLGWPAAAIVLVLLLGLAVVLLSARLFAVSRIAAHDPLTGLRNRRGLAAAWKDGRKGGRHMLLFLDLDGFKGVNDRLGHAVGDRLLKAMAERLSAARLPGVVLGRWGGDEFVALAPAALADRQEAAFLAAVRPPFAVAGAPVDIGLSCGRSALPGMDDAVAEASLLLLERRQTMKNDKTATISK